jgi:hypothetical protein
MRFRTATRMLEQVRCSSLVDWPIYPRLRGTMQGSTRSRNKPMRQGRNHKHSNLPPVDARPLTRSGWQKQEGAEISRFKPFRHLPSGRPLRAGKIAKRDPPRFDHF